MTVEYDLPALMAKATDIDRRNGRQDAAGLSDLLGIPRDVALRVLGLNKDDKRRKDGPTVESPVVSKKDTSVPTSGNGSSKRRSRKK